MGITFHELTRAEDDSPVIINFEQVEYFTPARADDRRGGTRVYLRDGKVLEVTEPMRKVKGPTGLS